MNALHLRYREQLVVACAHRYYPLSYFGLASKHARIGVVSPSSILGTCTYTVLYSSTWDSSLALF